MVGNVENCPVVVVSLERRVENAFSLSRDHLKGVLRSVSLCSGLTISANPLM